MNQDEQRSAKPSLQKGRSVRLLRAMNERNTFRSTRMRSSFRAQRSKRKLMAKKDHYQGDGDTWMEIEVAMKSTLKLEKKTRSLFYSMNTSIAVWEELPSEASKVVPSYQSSQSLTSFVAGTDKGGHYHAGKDVWVEIPVVQGKFAEDARKTRSLFYSVRTRNGHWDNPPKKAEYVISSHEMTNDVLQR